MPALRAAPTPEERSRRSTVTRGSARAPAAGAGLAEPSSTTTTRTPTAAWSSAERTARSTSGHRSRVGTTTQTAGWAASAQTARLLGRRGAHVPRDLRLHHARPVDELDRILTARRDLEAQDVAVQELLEARADPHAERVLAGDQQRRHLGGDDVVADTVDAGARRPRV